MPLRTLLSEIKFGPEIQYDVSGIKLKVLQILVICSTSKCFPWPHPVISERIFFKGVNGGSHAFGLDEQSVCNLLELS